MDLSVFLSRAREREREREEESAISHGWHDRLGSRRKVAATSWKVFSVLVGRNINLRQDKNSGRRGLLIEFYAPSSSSPTAVLQKLEIHSLGDEEGRGGGEIKGTK